MGGSSTSSDNTGVGPLTEDKMYQLSLIHI